MSETILSNRRQRKKEATKSKIIEIAVELFNKQGFEFTTMEQIAEQTDIAKGTLYNYFPTKELIVGTYIHGVIEGNGPFVDLMINELPDTRSRLYEVLVKMSRWNEQNREFVEIYLHSRMQTTYKSRNKPGEQSGLRLNLEKIFRLGQQEGELKEDLSIEFLATHFTVMYFTTLIRWLADPENFELPKELSLLIDFFLNGSKKQL